MSDTKQQPSPRDNAKLRRLFEAHETFYKTGRSTVVCDVCGGVIEFRKLSDEAETAHCSCGKYDATLRG